MSNEVIVWPRDASRVHDLSVAATAENASSGTCVFLGADVYNPHATDVAYLQVFDVAAASVTLGTTTPIAAFAIPAGQARLCATGYPMYVATRLSYAVTATRTGSGAPSSACNLTIWYR